MNPELKITFSFLSYQSLIFRIGMELELKVLSTSISRPIDCSTNYHKPQIYDIWWLNTFAVSINLCYCLLLLCDTFYHIMEILFDL